MFARVGARVQNVVLQAGGGIFPLRLAANHCQFNTTTFLASAANHVRCETRTRHKTGNVALSELRIVYSGFYLANGTGIETNVSNAVSIQAAIEWPGADPVTVQATFEGGDTGSILSGASQYISDPILPSSFGLDNFPANTTFWVRRLSSVSQTQRYGRHESSTSGIGERSAFSDGLSASQLLGSGAMSVPSGGADAAAIMGPTAILGRPISTPDIALCSIGDSITVGSNDSGIGGDGESGAGWIARAAWNVDGRSIPLMKIAVGGAQAVNLDANVKWLDYLPFLSHAIVAPGTNDMAVGSRSAAQVWANLQSIAAKCKNGGLVRVENALILPRTTSSDSWATVANQTPVTEFQTGGNRRSALNDLIVGGDENIDNYFDPNGFAADDAQPDRWIANATSDGVHPNSTVHAGIAGDFTSRLSTW